MNTINTTQRDFIKNEYAIEFKAYLEAKRAIPQLQHAARRHRQNSWNLELLLTNSYGWTFADTLELQSQIIDEIGE